MCVVPKPDKRSDWGETLLKYHKGFRKGESCVSSGSNIRKCACLISEQKFDDNARERRTMPTDIRIVHAHEFIMATPEGRLDFEKSKKQLHEVALASAALADYEIILDTRKAQSVMSAIDLWHLAAELSRLGESFSRKTAVLCPFEEFDKAEFFALCSKNRGFRIQAFTSFEDAFEWLTANG